MKVSQEMYDRFKAMVENMPDSVDPQRSVVEVRIFGENMKLTPSLKNLTHIGRLLTQRQIKIHKEIGETFRGKVTYNDLLQEALHNNFMLEAEDLAVVLFCCLNFSNGKVNNTYGKLDHVEREIEEAYEKAKLSDGEDPSFGGLITAAAYLLALTSPILRKGIISYQDGTLEIEEPEEVEDNPLV